MAALAADPAAVTTNRATGEKTVFLSDGTSGRCFGKDQGLKQLGVILRGRGVRVVERKLSRPATAAAAAIAGLTRCVLPPLPCLPSKFRLEVLAQRSPGISRSAFMAKHIEHPGSRHSMPASRNI